MRDVPPLRVVWSEAGLGRADIRIRRQGRGYLVEANPMKPNSVRHHTATWIYWFHHAPESVRDLVCDTSDGHHPSLARFTFSSYDGDRILMPDPHFYRGAGYRAIREQTTADPVDWSDRSDDLVWRGVASGSPVITMSPQMQDHPSVNQRLRMVLKARALGVDAAFVDSNLALIDPVLRAHGLMSDRVPKMSWGARKFALDVDGHTNAWDNLMSRLHLGCCVLKVASPMGYRQWFYDRLEPWRHFVPVRADLGDLAERIDWVRSNDDAAREIAAEGQALARSMTWESETAFAAARIAEHGTQHDG